MNTFAGITEGITDQIVIKNILAGYFNPDININWLQPLEDETDQNRSKSDGGWNLVFKYCESDDFKEAFQNNKYIIIHIDSDVLLTENVSDEYRIQSQDRDGEFSPEKIIELVSQKFEVAIGEDFYREYRDRIILAIAVHSTECWLLPLYYSDTRKAKLINCLETLNRELNRKEGYTIDPNDKNPRYYREISSKYRKKKDLLRLYPENPSFRAFIEEIGKRNITIED
jgi:hypothetical protein